MRRFRSRRFSRARRSVAWIPGLTCYDEGAGTAARLFTLGLLAGTARTWSVSVGITTDTDLSLHGGEDAVFQRLLGSLTFMAGRRDAGAGNVATAYPLRVVLAQESTSSLGVSVPPYVNGAELGNDNILFVRDTVVSGATLFGQTGANIEFSTLQQLSRVEFDIKAKRKLQSDAHLILHFQTVLPAGTTAADFQAFGGLRTLLKRPR